MVRGAALALACGLAFGQRVTVRLPQGVVAMDLEEYVAGVLAGEAGGFQSEQALEAMAVVARTYARVNRGRHRAEGFDFCETTHCQDFRLRGVTRREREAAERTEGQVLWAGQRLARVFYHAHCGGHTESAGVLWRESSRSWLRGAPDTFCGVNKWSARIPAAKLGLEALSVAERSPSGRVTKLSSDQGMLSAGELHRLVGRTLGWDVLHSSLYDVRKQGDVFLFEGRGRGHGVGLCQTGADARGRAGTSAAGILTAYFPGTSVRAWQWQRVAGERIEAEVADLGDAWVIEPAARALEEAERRSGRRAIGRIRLRVYPTVEDYRDHTGEPGFVLASSRRGLVRLQPPAKLRAQGVLPRVLLHEILHVLLTQNGERMPLWEEEGRVLLLTGERCAPASLNPNTERALASPRSEQELRTAYQNACAAAAGKLSSNNRR